jgi:ankyrin repeat protein
VAVRHGNRYIIQLLLERGADLEAADQGGRTPLHLAVHRDKPSEDVVRFLLACGADLKAVDQDGCTPLHLAASYGCAVQELHGANLTAINKHNGAPLHMATHYSHRDIV